LLLKLPVVVIYDATPRLTNFDSSENVCEADIAIQRFLHLLSNYVPEILVT